MLPAALPFIVKVCGITARDDGQAALDAGANALGFNFYPKSPRYVSPEAAAGMADSLRGDFLRVGIFVHPTQEEVSNASSFLNVIQVHGEANFASALPVWKAVNPGMIPAENAAVQAWLLDSFTPVFGGSGQTFDWSLAAAFPFPAIVAGGLDGDNVAEAIRVARPWGVDSCSRLESAPGVKDQNKVAAFVSNARAAFGSLARAEGKTYEYHHF
jgi:phosphoribosylanthranilate isomerase